MRSRTANRVLIVSAVALVLLQGLRGMPTHGSALAATAPEEYGIHDRVVAVLPGPDDLAGCVKWCWFAEPSSSAVVLHVNVEDDSGIRSFGASVVGHSGKAWHLLGATTGSKAHDDDGLVVFSSPVAPSTITHRYGVRGDYVLTYGHANDPAIAGVQIMDADGASSTVPVINDMFASFTSASTICEIDALSATGEVIQHIGPADDPMLAHQIETLAPNGCP